MVFSRFCQPLARSTRKIKKVMGFDIETYGSMNNFLLASFVCDDFKVIFRKEEDIIQFLNQKRTREYIIVATNLAFDFLGVFRDDLKQDYSFSERNGILYTFKYYQYGDRKRPVNFYDTVRFFPVSVEVLGKIIGIKKLDHPKCFGRRPTTDQEWLDLEEYCINDSLISQQFFKQMVLPFLTENGLPLKSTIASTSLADWRTNYLDETLYVEDQDIHKCCFSAYYGGRTETFRRGSFKNITCYDFNSLYPSVMLNDLPHPNHGYYVKRISMYDIKKREGVAYIEGWQDPTFIPILPQRRNQRLVFACGKIQGHYTFLEIRKALENGFTIEHIGEGVYYTKTKAFFKEFVLDKYRLRQEQKKNNDPMEVMSKLIMNSLYGKFGFNYREKSTIVMEKDLTPKIVEEATYINELDPGVFSLSSENGQPPNYSFPIFACYITALARLKLYEQLKAHQDHILYCDTDSVFFANDHTLPSSQELGDLKEEYRCKDGIFVRPKFYYTTKAKIKGVKIKLDKRKFIQIVNGKTIYEKHFIKLRSALRSKPSHKWGKLKVNQIIEKSKKLSVEDSKRNWKTPFKLWDQQTSEPFLFED